MKQIYRDGELINDPTPEEQAAADEQGAYISIESDGQPLAVAAADIMDVLLLAASNEPEKVVNIRLEIFEG